MKKLTTYLLIALLLLSGFVVAQDSTKIFRYPDANKMNISVKASATKTIAGFKYEYSISSAKSSEQNANDFFYLRKATIDSIKSPTRWISEPDNDNDKVFWGSIDSLQNIFPGEKKNGFILYSKELPSIIEFHSSGEVSIPELSEEPDSVENDNIFENSFKGWTIGPQVPPTPFIPLDFLDTLKSYVHQADLLKWIVDEKNDDDKEKHEKDNNNKLVKELIKYLDKAREQLAKNKTKEAKKQLKEFVEKVEENYHEKDDDEKKEKLEHGYLTSEAYALLKYNAEYLIGKLK